MRIFLLLAALIASPVLALGAETPVDNGPNTPEANRAFQGGGVILQGAPGAPAPTPHQMAPAQTPAPTRPQSN